MAGVLNLAAGTAPTSTTNTSIYVPSGAVAGPNGENQGERVKVLNSFGDTLQLTDAHLANYIRNGGFWFAQRQAPGSGTTYSATAGRAITADGWGVTNENASASYRRVDTNTAAEAGLQSRFYGLFLKTTANGKLVISQVIESHGSMALKARTVRFTAWMKGEGAGITVRMGVLNLTTAGTVDVMPATFVSAFGGSGVNPTFGTNLSLCASSATPDGGSSNGFGATCVLTTSWQRFSCTVFVPSTALNLIPTIWSDSQVTVAQGIDIGQASLTDGMEIQDWSPLELELEFARVRRFYQRSFAADASGPQTNIGVGTGEVVAIAGKAGAVANSGIIGVRYITPLRAAATTTTLYNPGAANALMRNETGAADMGATAASGGTALGFNVIATGVAATAVGDLIGIHYTSDAEL